VLIAIGFALIAYASWLNTGLTHDWAGGDFLPSLFAARPIGAGDPTLQGFAGISNLIRREAYVLGYIDGFWIIAWVLTAGIVLLLLLRPPPPNPLTPPRSDRQ
jgi:hypothetical protein